MNEILEVAEHVAGVEVAVAKGVLASLHQVGGCPRRVDRRFVRSLVAIGYEPVANLVYGQHRLAPWLARLAFALAIGLTLDGCGARRNANIVVLLASAATILVIALDLV